MRLEGFDVVFGLATPAIDLFIEHASVSLVQVGDNEARVGPFGASLDAGDDALDAAPAFGAVEELLEAAYFVVSWRSLEASLRVGLEDFDVSAQGRGWRDAEDVIEAVRPTPVENLGAAVMAVGPEQDLSVGPVGADGAHKTAQEGLDFLAAGPFGRPKDGGDEAALAVEHDDRLKAILVIVRVEQPQLLAAMHRVERVVDVERDSFGNFSEGLAIEIEHCPAHAQQGANVRQILEPRDRRLRAQFPIGRRQIERHLEHRIASQTIGVVAVLVAGADHQEPKTNDIGQAVRDLTGIAGVCDAGGEPVGEAKPLLHLAQRQNAAIRRKQTAVKLGSSLFQVGELARTSPAMR